MWAGFLGLPQRGSGGAEGAGPRWPGARRRPGATGRRGTATAPPQCLTSRALGTEQPESQHAHPQRATGHGRVQNRGPSPDELGPRESAPAHPGTEITPSSPVSDALSASTGETPGRGRRPGRALEDAAKTGPPARRHRPSPRPASGRSSGPVQWSSPTSHHRRHTVSPAPVTSRHGPELAGLCAVDDLGGDGVELAVLVLGGLSEQQERLVGGAVTGRHQDPFGLLDHGPVLQRSCM